ncbi:MAG: FAD-binding oxidoreductase [Bacteroidales bacterium]|nr:FAD-binding oxidoreductase [Bacteroidales bacterium]
MKEYIVKILEIFDVSHDVKGFHLEKPEGYTFRPGQAANVAIGKKGWEEKQRPFTFTNLPGDDILELIIKIYPSRNGLTKELEGLKKGDELIINKPWGSIEYRGEGVFIAGGAGITPFISILRDLEKKDEMGKNILIFANNTSKDIIMEEEFDKMLGSDRFINILAEEKTDKYHNGFISKEFLEEQLDHFNRVFYLCGPPPMMKAVEEDLAELGVKKESLVKEEF